MSNRYFVRFATYTTRAGRMTERASWVICYWGSSKADCERWMTETVRRGVNPASLKVGYKRSPASRAAA